jgi:hypothetical protein
VATSGDDVPLIVGAWLVLIEAPLGSARSASPSPCSDGSSDDGGMASQRQHGHGKDMMQIHVPELGDGAKSLRVKGIKLEVYLRDIPV